MQALISQPIASLVPINLKETIEKVMDRLDIHIDTYYVDNTNFIPTAKALKAKGREIIISRGGIARRVREQLQISVVEIQITGYDILQALSGYIGGSRKIAVIENEDFTRGAQKVADILGMNVKCYTVGAYEQIGDRIQEAIRENARVIVSGAWLATDPACTANLKRLGIENRSIDSGEESIIAAINQAMNLYEMTLVERRKKEEFKAVLDSVKEGIIAVDRNGFITTVNPSAEKMFSFSPEIVTGKPILNYVSSHATMETLTKSKSLERLEDIGAVKVVTTAVPIMVEGTLNGVVSTFQEVKKIQEIEQKVRLKLSQAGLVAKYTFNDIIGASKSIHDAVMAAKQYSLSDSTVVILGETGTGKEMFAQAIHNFSMRRGNAFVGVNCAAVPRNLLESELFGYVEGAFTGARKKGKIGLFELVHRGTIFLDEICEMDMEIQARLLRVIQEKEIMRIGDDKIVPVDVRIIAATNKSMREEMENGRFREDLFFRLNVLDLRIPPLRERRDDILALLESFSHKYRLTISWQIIADLLEKDFHDYQWPGNIRELQNLVERIGVLYSGSNQESNNFRPILAEALQQSRKPSKNEGVYWQLGGTLEELEYQILRRVLEEEHFNKARTAERLGINRSTLHRKLAKEPKCNK
jgi:PAS domain S-box-containing protein